MELSEQIQEGNLKILQEIAATLAKAGITVTPPASAKDVFSFLDYNTLHGTFQGAQIHVRTTTKAKRLSITWGPFIQWASGYNPPQPFYSSLDIAGETYQTLLTKFSRQVRKIPVSTPRGQQAVRAWIAYCISTNIQYDSVFQGLKRHLEFHGAGKAYDYKRFEIDMTDTELVDALNGKNMETFIANNPCK